MTNKHNYYIYNYSIVLIVGGLLIISSCLPLGIYNKHSNNILENFYLVNLLLMAAVAAISAKEMEYLSVFLALLMFVCILVWYSWKKVRNTKWGTFIQLIAKRVEGTCQREKLEELDGAPEIDGFLENRHFDLDREPLLANLNTATYS